MWAGVLVCLCACGGQTLLLSSNFRHLIWIYDCRLLLSFRGPSSRLNSCLLGQLVPRLRPRPCPRARSPPHPVWDWLRGHNYACCAWRRWDCATSGDLWPVTAAWNGMEANATAAIHLLPPLRRVAAHLITSPALTCLLSALALFNCSFIR